MCVCACMLVCIYVCIQLVRRILEIALNNNQVPEGWAGEGGVGGAWGNTMEGKPAL